MANRNRSRKLRWRCSAASLLLFCSAGIVLGEATEKERGTEKQFSFSGEILEIGQIRMKPEYRLKIVTYRAAQIRQSKGGTLKVGFDTRWGVKVRITHAEGDEPLFQKGEEVTFAIHSPTRALTHIVDGGFDSDGLIGKTVRLKLLATEYDDGKIRFSVLRRNPRAE